MSTPDTTRVPTPSRRDVLAVTAAAACACAGCPLLSAAPAAPKRAGRPVDVGPLKDLAGDGVIDRWAAAHGFFLVRRRGRLHAVSSTCTHKKVALVAARGDAGFKCPRHGSIFDPGGRATKAPARKPLPRFGIRLNDAGRVVVDTGSSFAEKNWDDPAAFVRLDE